MIDRLRGDVRGPGQAVAADPAATTPQRLQIDDVCIRPHPCTHPARTRAGSAGRDLKQFAFHHRDPATVGRSSCRRPRAAKIPGGHQLAATFAVVDHVAALQPGSHLGLWLNSVFETDTTMGIAADLLQPIFR